MIEHQLHPLFGFFEAARVPRGVHDGYADIDSDGRMTDARRARLDTAVPQLTVTLTARKQGAAA